MLLTEEKVRNRLNQYFNKENSCFKARNNSRTLKALDNDFDHYYTGVTFDYIWKYVLRKRCDQGLLCYILVKMLIENKLNFIFCTTVCAIVFESKIYSTGHYNSYTDTNEGMDTDLSFVSLHFDGVREAVELLKLINLYYLDYEKHIS